MVRKALLALIGMAFIGGLFYAVIPSTIPTAKASDLFRVVETNGNYAVGWGTSGEGDAVKEIFGGYRLNFTPHDTYHGLADGTFNFTNGLYMATTADCEGVIQKSSSTATGTAWAEKFDGAGNFRLVNRYCDNNQGGDGGASIYLAGFNNGTQFTVCGLPFRCDGFYSLMHEG